MNEDFVPYELAVKLKEKGFPQHITEEAYIVDNYGEEEYDIGDRLPIPLVPDYMDDVAAPTIPQVLEWLREEKGLFVQIMFVDKSSYYYEVIDISTAQVKCSSGDYKESPELAAIAGIEYVIDNIL